MNDHPKTGISPAYLIGPGYQAKDVRPTFWSTQSLEVWRDQLKRLMDHRALDPIDDPEKVEAYVECIEEAFRYIIHDDVLRILEHAHYDKAQTARRGILMVQIIDRSRDVIPDARQWLNSLTAQIAVKIFGFTEDEAANLRVRQNHLTASREVAR